MNIINVTDLDNITDCDNITSTNTTLCNCTESTDSENDSDITIPALIFTIPCGLSFICLMSLMVYTLIKPLFNKKTIL